MDDGYRDHDDDDDHSIPMSHSSIVQQASALSTFTQLLFVVVVIFEIFSL